VRSERFPELRRSKPDKTLRALVNREFSKFDGTVLCDDNVDRVSRRTNGASQSQFRYDAADWRVSGSGRKAKNNAPTDGQARPSDERWHSANASQESSMEAVAVDLPK
jgi:hypothetical protein